MCAVRNAFAHHHVLFAGTQPSCFAGAFSHGSFSCAQKVGYCAENNAAAFENTAQWGSKANMQAKTQQVNGAAVKTYFFDCAQGSAPNGFKTASGTIKCALNGDGKPVCDRATCCE